MEWIDVKTEKPVFNKIVEVKLDDDTETLAFIDDDDYRTCWLIKGTGGQYWRSFVSTVTHWREIEKQ